MGNLARVSHCRALAWALLPLFFAGCGGSSHHSSNPTTSTDTIGPQIALVWPARARDFAAPSAATAAQITFPGAGVNGADLTQVVARPDGAAAVTKTYQLGIAVHPGRYLLRVDFLADASSTGASLATAMANVSITNDGALRTLDGKDLGTIAYGSNVVSIAIAPGQTVDVGRTAQLVVTATTAGGIAALAAGSASFFVSYGSAYLTVDATGTLTGITPGTASLFAKVDGIDSPAANIDVVPAGIVARTLRIASTDMVADSTRGKLWVASANGVSSLDPTTGTLSTSIPLSGNPSVLALSDDGSTLYAGLQDLGTVRRLDLTTNTAGSSFSVSTTRFGSAGYATDIAIQPGSDNTLAVIRRDSDSFNDEGPIIFDNGVQRANYLGFYSAAQSVWTAPNRIVAYPGSFEGLQEVSVDDQGATPVRSVNTLADLGRRLVLVGTRLYSANGVVIDSTTLAPIGSFVQTILEGSNPIYCGPAIDVGRKRAYFIEVGATGSYARLHIYNTESFAEVASQRISGITIAALPNSPFDTRLSLFGTDRLAFRLPDQIVFLDNISSL